MRLQNLFEAVEFNSDEFEDMEISDALFVLAEMAEDEKLSEKELEIIEDMFDRLFGEEDDEIEIEDEDLEEANIVDMTDTAAERNAHFKISTMADRIKDRIYQRKYRRRSDVKMKAKKRAAVAKRCKGKNRSPQLSKPGSTTYVCKLKDRFRSKLMKRVAKRYRK